MSEGFWPPLNLQAAIPQVYHPQTLIFPRSQHYHCTEKKIHCYDFLVETAAYYFKLLEPGLIRIGELLEAHIVDPAALQIFPLKLKQGQM